MKKILILGQSSYIGKSFYDWLSRWPNDYRVNIVSVRNELWRDIDLSVYDSVINCAGIAHINNIKQEMEGLFYAVNRDLAIEICSCVKKANVKQFIHFSSMNVYGDCCGKVNTVDAVNPTSFYGNSKLEGDLGIHLMADDVFCVASIRPPFVYGKGCSGNYPIISKIAHKAPMFADYNNKKSMIYIDNLCEFLRLLVEDGCGGVFIPQNRELISTADLVREIANVNGHKILFTKKFNWAIQRIVRISKVVRRAFANDCCDLELSNYFDWKYCIVSFQKSIKVTEGY